MKLRHILIPRFTLSAAVLLALPSHGGGTSEDRGALLAAGLTAASGPIANPASNVRLTVAPTGNAARYRVREQLVGRDRENDAVGETTEITGSIVVDSSGTPIPAQSRIVVRTGSFRSDSDRRDNYVRNRLFATEQFPTVEFVPTAVRGLAASSGSPVPATPTSFELLGQLTVKGVTRQTTWQVTARQDANGNVVGQAATKFTFEYLELAKPRVPVVLGVADTIRLEYDFNLVVQR